VSLSLVDVEKKKKKKKKERENIPVVCHTVCGGCRGIKKE
jgi:hypothetical protein